LISKVYKCSKLVGSFKETNEVSSESTYYSFVNAVAHEHSKGSSNVQISPSFSYGMVQV